MRRLVASLAVAAACAVPAAARESLDEVRAAIEAQNRRLAEAVSRGDEEAAAAVYADDARLMPPNAETIEGRAAIGAHWGAKRESGVADAAIDTREVVLGKGTATELGVYRFRGADTTLLDEGNYVVVWKKVDGTWRIWRDLRP
jgi:ketosteroid isomerase-like protein